VTISFDLDDTLIPGTKRFDTERQNLLHKMFSLESLRIGTVELIKALQAKGHKIYIYTTSFRSPTKIWWTFFLYGVKVDKIINQEIHERTLREKAKDHSKYPPIFNIDIHVDDSKGVEIEGHRHNFKTIIVAEADSAWTESVLTNIGLHSSG
jgi:FMN phosphatase YigB (HAD superfamily)